MKMIDNRINFPAGMRLCPPKRKEQMEIFLRVSILNERR